MPTKIVDAPELPAVEVKTRRYLLSALTKDAAPTLEELNTTVTAIGGLVESSEDMGVRKLNFPINKQLQLSLVSIFFTTEPKTLKELEAELVHSEKIERYLITEWRAGLDEQGNKRPKRKSKEKLTDV